MDDDDGVEKSIEWMGGVLPNDDGGGHLLRPLVFYLRLLF